MKHHKLGRVFTLLALAVLFLAACQPALETANLPAEPAETAGVNGTAASVEPTGAVSQATPTSEGSALFPTATQVPEGWQVFNYTAPGPALGYSLIYPKEWNISPESKYSRVFSEIQKEPAGMGPPLRLYVSAFPQEYANQDWEVYNFIPSESIQEFMALPVGGSKLREPNAMTPDYFTYTRLPDRKVSGRTALVIENSKVWEAPSGTKDRAVIILTEGATFILGMYYETPEQLAKFEQVLDSFQFIP